MNKKILIGFSIGLVIGLLLGIFVFQNPILPRAIDVQNPKIYCNAKAENVGNSNWRMTEGFPVLSSYSYGAKNWSTSQVSVVISIDNNNSVSIFNTVIELSYPTEAVGVWNTTTKTDIGFIDVHGRKQTEITITNPNLILWNTKRPDYTKQGTVWENVTVYVLDLTALKIVCYGYAKP